MGLRTLPEAFTWGAFADAPAPAASGNRITDGELCGGEMYSVLAAATSRCGGDVADVAVVETSRGKAFG